MVCDFYLGEEDRRIGYLVSDVSSTFTGRILSLMTWFVHVRDSHSCRTLSVDGACPSSVISVVQMPIKTIPELFKPAFGVHPKTGDAEPEDPGKPG